MTFFFFGNISVEWVKTRPLAEFVTAPFTLLRSSRRKPFLRETLLSFITSLAKRALCVGFLSFFLSFYPGRVSFLPEKECWKWSDRLTETFVPSSSVAAKLLNWPERERMLKEETNCEWSCKCLKNGSVSEKRWN